MDDLPTGRLWLAESFLLIIVRLATFAYIGHILDDAYPICVSGITFKAHRLILAACSKHFQDLFEGMPSSLAGLIVILDGTSAHNMASLLEFMYRGEVHVSQESLSSFLKAAEYFQVCARLFFRK